MLISYCTITISSFTQNPYISVNAGYGFPMSSQNIPNFYNSVSYYDSANIEQIDVSLGKGFHFGGSLGYMFNKYIGFEVGISYLLGTKTEAQDLSFGGNSKYFYQSNMLQFSPVVIISPGFEKVNPYAKFGLVFGIGSILLEHNFNDDEGEIIRDFEMSGGYAFGGSASIGVSVSIMKNLSILGECNMINLSYAPTKGEITKFTQNNNDLLPGLTTKEKETDFVDKYSYYYYNPSPDDQPAKELKTKYPFGSIGFNVGLQYKF